MDGSERARGVICRGPRPKAPGLWTLDHARCKKAPKAGSRKQTLTRCFAVTTKKTSAYVPHRSDLIWPTSQPDQAKARFATYDRHGHYRLKLLLVLVKLVAVLLCL